MSQDFKFIVLNNAKELGNKVEEHLKKIRKDNVEHLVAVNQVRFSNGEAKVELQSSVRGKDVFILADVGNHSDTYRMFGKNHAMSPDDHFQDLKRVVSAIRGNADRITLIMPLLYQSRQHNTNGRESMDCAIALQELEKMSVDTIATFDAHDPNVYNAIPLMSFDNFFPTHTILNEFIENENVNYDNLLIVSPDEGAMKRSRYYSSMLGADIGMFYKRRDYSKVVNGKNPIVEHKYLGREEEGLDYIIVDDMIASGGSIIDIFKVISTKKPNSVYSIATFSLFTEGVEIFDKAYEDGLFNKIYSTNLSYVPKEILEKEWFVSVDCSEFLAQVIDNYNKRESISPLLNGKLEMLKKIEDKKTKK